MTTVDTHQGPQPARRCSDAISTPALLLDLDRLESNLRAMQEMCARHGVAFRPHCKGHKSGAFAKLQVAHGAVGVCCATLAEAAVMIDAGIPSILLTSPIVTATMVAQLAALNARASDFLAVVDSPALLEQLDREVAKSGKPLQVLIDLDVGQRRTGAANEKAAVAVAEALTRYAHLRYAGVQAYYGQIQAIKSYAERRQKAAELVDRLKSYIAALDGAGFRPKIVSGGGTGTSHIDPQFGVFTELQAGSFALMDNQYIHVEISEEDPQPFKPALSVLAHVVSANHPDRVAINAGWKAIPSDSGTPLVVRGPSSECTYAFAGDEFGFLTSPSGANLPPLGTPIEMIVPHCDTTTSLHGAFRCVRGDELVDTWPIEARGRWEGAPTP